MNENETVLARPKKTEAEIKAAANAAAQKHRANIKHSGKVALQQWVPNVRRDLLREWLKLATARHEAGDEAFFENIRAQLIAYTPDEPEAASTETNG
jgi:hypothetical protein